MANGRSEAKGASRGGRDNAPSAGARGRSRQGASPRGGARGGKRFGAEGFRREAGKTELKMADFNEQLAKAKEKKSKADTAAAKAAADKSVKAAEAAKKAYMAKTATAREKARTTVQPVKRVKSTPTGAGGKTPGPKGQRGGTPSPAKSFGRGTGKGQQGQSRRGGAKGGRRSGGRGGGRGGRSGGRGGCFIAETLVQMLDGTTKPIINIQVGEHTKGGIVESKMEFLPTSIYNYKGVEVSGSHWVIEDNQFIEVENSKHGILTDKIETVYCFKTSENRIWVNGIEFGDYESGSYEDWEPHFKQVKEKLNKELLVNNENN
jgi:hypothetical protein